MGDRSEPRQQIALPVRIWGTDANGKAFLENVFTLDVSRHGARLEGVRAALAAGGRVSVQAGKGIATFRVAWAGGTAGTRAGQVGLAAEDPSNLIWNLTLPGAKPDAVVPARAGLPPAGEADALAGADAEYVRTFSARVQRATSELRQIQDILKAGMVDGRVLQEFRESVDQLRRTGWAVQQFLELQARGGNPDAIISLLEAERIRAATQLTRQLITDAKQRRLPASNGQIAELLAALAELQLLLQERARANGA